MQSRYEEFDEKLYKITSERNITTYDDVDIFEEFIIQVLAGISEELHGCQFGKYDDNHIYVAATIGSDSLTKLLTLNQRFSELSIVDITEEVHNDRTSFMPSRINGYATVVIKINTAAITAFILPLFDQHLTDHPEFAARYQAMSYPFSRVENSFNEIFVPMGIGVNDESHDEEHEFNTTSAPQDFLWQLTQQSSQRANLTRETLDKTLLSEQISLVNEYSHAVEDHQFIVGLREIEIDSSINKEKSYDEKISDKCLSIINEYVGKKSHADDENFLKKTLTNPIRMSKNSLFSSEKMSFGKYHSTLEIDTAIETIKLMECFLNQIKPNGSTYTYDYAKNSRGLSISNRHLCYPGLLFDMKSLALQQPHKLDEYRKKTGTIDYTALDCLENLKDMCEELQKMNEQPSSQLIGSLTRLTEHVKQYHFEKRETAEGLIKIAESEAKKFADNFNPSAFGEVDRESFLDAIKEMVDALRAIMNKQYPTELKMRR